MIVLLTHWFSYDRLISQRVLHWQLKLPSRCGDSFSVQAMLHWLRTRPLIIHANSCLSPEHFLRQKIKEMRFKTQVTTNKPSNINTQYSLDVAELQKRE